MSEYRAPLRDMQFVLRELADLEGISKLPGCEDATLELATPILEEAGKFASGVLDPLNRVGDREGVKLHGDDVSTATGWTSAYSQFIEGGWNGLASETEWGGQGLPRVLSCLVEEMWNSTNISFALCPMLTRAAIEAIELRGSHALKEAYLPKLVSGEWTGTMNLTEPAAGSDLSAVTSRAVPLADGTYSVSGQKIFITYGDHDLTPNIIHLVLARLPDAPEGVRGISLFLVPKVLVNEDGSLGRRNDVRCVSLEHKLGIHASPTAVLAFGDKEGAVGYLVGEENRGLEIMFLTMNAARYSVGIEGVGLSERAYQRARSYARDRIQGTEAGVVRGGRVSILRHPDVRRMLLLMKAQTEAMRAVACVVGAATDRARAHPDEAERASNQAFVDLMIPIVKGWSTENAFDIASLGVQVHGGMGFIEETGAAQYLRDARITSIYEGTTGIQANDLIGRKVSRDGGAAIRRVIDDIQGIEARLADSADPQLGAIAQELTRGRRALEDAVKYIVETYAKDVRSASVGAVPFLKLFGIVAGGWQMGRAALVAHARLAAGDSESAFYRAKVSTAEFYANHVLSQAGGLAHAVTRGAAAAVDFDDEQF